MKQGLEILIHNQLLFIVAAITFFVTGNYKIIAQERTITGTIYDESGGALPTASITVRGTTKEVKTDDDGNYNISVGQGDILIISFPGFQQMELLTDGRDNVDATLYSKPIDCYFPGDKRTFFGRIFYSIGNLFKKNE